MQSSRRLAAVKFYQYPLPEVVYIDQTLTRDVGSDREALSRDEEGV